MMLSELIGGVDATGHALGLGLDAQGRPLVRLGPGVDPASVRITDLTEDSRTVLPGSLFIARAGTQADGRAFIAPAVAAGAAAVLTDEQGAGRVPEGRARGIGPAVLVSAQVPLATARLAERFYGEPSRALDVVAITGTNGKTTTAHLVHQLLNGAGTRCGLIGTVHIDDGREVAPASLTTPPATEVSRTLATMVEAGCRAAAMEASSHALHQDRVAALHVAVGVFTNLTGDHLDYHGTMEAYAAAKARLFEMLPPDGWAVVSADDPWTPRMLRDCRAAVIRCRIAEAGSGPPCGTPCGIKGGEALACVRSMGMGGTRVEWCGPWGRFEATMRLVGRHNVMNALQAMAAAWCVGVAPRDLEEELARAAAPPGRLEPVTAPSDPFAVLVDYAHSDDALRNALATLRPLVGPGGRLSVVFGCGGDRDATKRPRMGAAAAELADLVYVTSDNPRRERPSDIIDQVLAGVPREARPRVAVDADRRRAIGRAVADARAGDIVLIAGKGHETYQILPDGKGGTVRTDFDDRAEARAALAAAGLGGAAPAAGAGTR